LGQATDVSNIPGAGRAAEVISAAECLQLLATEEVGRLGVIVDGRPDIFPVNYTVDGDGILFRTADGSKLEGALHGPVVFEVDQLSRESRTGWSVVVHGTAATYTRFDTPDRRETRQPWLDTIKPHLIRLAPTRITGRRIQISRASDDPASG